MRKSSASALSIEVQGLTDDQIYAPVDDMEPAYVRRRQRPESVELQARIDSISNSYRMDESDSMTDYFETNFYAFSRIEDEDSARFRHGEKERLMANRLVRLGKRREFSTLRQGRKRRVRIVRNAVESGSKIHVGTPKSGKKRTAPLPGFLADELKEFCAEKPHASLVFEAPRRG